MASHRCMASDSSPQHLSMPSEQNIAKHRRVRSEEGAYRGAADETDALLFGPPVRLSERSNEDDDCGSHRLSSDLSTECRSRSSSDFSNRNRFSSDFSSADDDISASDSQPVISGHRRVLSCDEISLMGRAQPVTLGHRRVLSCGEISLMRESSVQDSTDTKTPTDVVSTESACGAACGSAAPQEPSTESACGAACGSAGPQEEVPAPRTPVTLNVTNIIGNGVVIRCQRMNELAGSDAVISFELPSEKTAVLQTFPKHCWRISSLDGSTIFTEYNVTNDVTQSLILGSPPTLGGAIAEAAATIEEAQQKAAAEQAEKDRIEALKRCGTCSKKLKISAIACRCGKRFCHAHSFFEDHNCMFDYKTANQEELAKRQPVIADKLVDRV